ncbi:hypothetical protein GCM10007301_15780 [Azorhizobium oxalatiphilum]|uniref:Uncharacterized protein n=1 Tax=Azorhizobium oxalatiphilum TaxID=980631 RepID=A0A917BUZ5_9HYPH|nr:hypothetical protein GCM10007301_15780 [Azorhizobium oxalatiphilum]
MLPEGSLASALVLILVTPLLIFRLGMLATLLGARLSFGASLLPHDAAALGLLCVAGLIALGIGLAILWVLPALLIAIVGIGHLLGP